MKKITLSLAVITIAYFLLSYTLKPNIIKAPEVNDIVSCYYVEPTNEKIQSDAGKSGFAAMHPIPTPFVLANPKGKTISFKSADGIDAQGYFIKSKRKSKKWLFVIQEWWGLNDYIKKEAETYYGDLKNVNVIALDMYDGKVATTRDSAGVYMKNAKAERLENIIKAAMAYAGEDAKIFTVGWCFGGGWSLQSTILAGKQAAGCIMYYGRPETNFTRLKSINCDVIGFFGNQDKGIPPETVNKFEGLMKEANKNITIYRYEAGHGFANPSNPVFNKEYAADAHTKAIAFLKERM